jgi:hypothetical protein
VDIKKLDQLSVDYDFPFSIFGILQADMKLDGIEWFSFFGRLSEPRADMKLAGSSVNGLSTCE